MSEVGDSDDDDLTSDGSLGSADPSETNKAVVAPSNHTLFQSLKENDFVCSFSYFRVQAP